MCRHSTLLTDFFRREGGAILGLHGMAVCGRQRLPVSCRDGGMVRLRHQQRLVVWVNHKAARRVPQMNRLCPNIACARASRALSQAAHLHKCWCRCLQ